MFRYFSELWTGAWSLAVGMGITFVEFFKPKITLHYPHESLKMSARYRGHIQLIGDEEGKPLCVVCGMCEKACPSNCISISGEKPEGSKKKVLTSYQLDFTKCSLCGSCVDSCNFGAVEFSREYNLASTRKEDYHFDLLKRLEERKQ
jgi:NADH-quinone oxidoreductase subunit I